VAASPGARSHCRCDEVIDQLRPMVDGRAGNEALLLRWAYTQCKPHTKIGRRSWGKAYEVSEPWARAIKLAGLLPGTIMYALRHSSIVRGLSRMLPIRLVAALHDTSTAMIERHYAAHIVDLTEELARRTALSLAVPAAPAANDVTAGPLAIEARPAFVLAG
jgi:hypothetical protein